VQARHWKALHHNILIVEHSFADARKGSLCVMLMLLPVVPLADVEDGCPQLIVAPVHHHLHCFLVYRRVEVVYLQERHKLPFAAGTPCLFFYSLPVKLCASMD
jgi:hypothetical protein